MKKYPKWFEEWWKYQSYPFSDGGGDWYDASVEHLVVPEGVNLNDAFSAWRKWYHDEYSVDMHYIDFCEWLKTKHGARDTTEAEVEVFSDDI